MNALYPLKFKPIYKPKIWGGKQIGDRVNFPDAPQDNCGEIWLLSGLEDEETPVMNGFLADNTISELVEIYMGDLVGDDVFTRYEGQFPLLFKILHTAEHLSVQVHPSPEQAEVLECEPKTEMWVVLGAQEDAKIFLGFQQAETRDRILKSIETNGLQDRLNAFPAKTGQVYFVPSGRIHALGAGLTVAEIQQSADTTFRLYDWGRVDAQGQSRELHLEEGLAALDYSAFKEQAILCTKIPNFSNNLVTCPQFQTNEILLTQPIAKDISSVDSFIVYLCTEGLGFAEYDGERYPITAGEVLLIPACIDHLDLYPVGAMRLLEVYIP